MTRRLCIGLAAAALVLVALCLFADLASAQQAGAQTKVPDHITEIFETNVKKWESALKKSAAHLFWLLVTIELAWGAGRLLVRGADMGEWLSELVGQVMFIGFFWALLDHSTEWADFVIRSFQQAADQAAKDSGVQSGARPSDVFYSGVNAAYLIVKQVSIFSPGDSVGLLIGAFIVMVCFSLMAAFMIVVMIQSYFTIYTGVLFMGFGGSRWTKAYALAQASYAVSVGAKLFVIQLIAALSQQVFADLTKEYAETSWLGEIEQTLLIVGVSVIFFILMQSIPNLVQGMLQGQSLASPEQMTAAARELHRASTTIMNAAKTIAGAAIGGGKAVLSAGQLASRQLQDPALNTGKLGDGLLGRTGRNLGGAAYRQAAGRLGGWLNKSAGGQMAADMQGRSGGDAIDKKLGRDKAAQGGGNITGAGGQGKGQTGGGKGQAKGGQAGGGQGKKP